MPVRVELHPGAAAEAAAARRWYAERSVDAAEAFMAELDHAIGAIAEAPERWPGGKWGTRRYLLHRFPFLIIYRVSGTMIEVLAVAHAKRRPGYWRRRMS